MVCEFTVLASNTTLTQFKGVEPIKCIIKIFVLRTIRITGSRVVGGGETYALRPLQLVMNFRKSPASTTVSCVPQNDHLSQLYILCLYTNFENRVTNLKMLI